MKRRTTAEKALLDSFGKMIDQVAATIPHAEFMRRAKASKACMDAAISKHAKKDKK